MKRFTRICANTQNPSLVIDEYGRVLNENNAFRSYFRVFQSEKYIQNYFIQFDFKALKSITNSGVISLDLTPLGEVMDVFCSQFNYQSKPYWFLILYPKKWDTEGKKLMALSRWDSMEKVEDFSFELDTNLTICAFEKPEENELSIADEKLVGSPLSNLRFQPNTIQEIKTAGTKCIESGEIQLVKYFIIYHDFQRFFEARFSKINEERVLMIIKDITDEVEWRKGAKKDYLREIRKNKSFLAGIIESSLDLIFAWDLGFELVEFNISAEKNFGLTRKEVESLKAQDLFFEKNQIQEIVAVIESKKKFEGDIECLKRDGETFCAHLSISALKDLKGETYGFVGVGKNVTGQRKKTALLENQNNRLSKIFEASDNLIMCTIDTDLKITTHNDHFRKTAKKYLKADFQEHFLTNILEVIQNNVAEDQLVMLWNKYLQSLEGVPQQFEVYFLEENGSKIWFEVFISPIQVQGIIAEISVIAYEITEKKRRVEVQLYEKDILVKEIHHRVKNNLQVINSLLNLQGRYIEDPETKNIFLESQNRIKSMAFIHEKLYLSENFSKIDFADYLTSITSNLFYSYTIDTEKVKLIRKFDNFTVGIEQSIPIALIINEIFSNALKYAFPNGREGEIYIEVREDGSKVDFRMGDNGVGLKEKVPQKKNNSLGMELIETLSNQLDAERSVINTKGLHYCFKFEKLK
ncbi:MAG: PAS domain S-box-containing protein [Luteibaculaceae bacterium]|jgi:PAS domain S-box-containing protein